MNSSKDDLLIGLEHGKTITYTIKNNGLAKAIYGVALEGDNSTSFSMINPSNIEIAPGKEGNLYLYVSPPLFTPLGDYSLKVVAKVKGADMEMSKELKMKVVESANDTEPETIVKESWLKKMWGKIVSFFNKPFEKKEQKSEENNTEEVGLDETKELEEVNETALLENTTEEEVVANESINETVAAEFLNESDSDANETLVEEINETAEVKEILEAENNESVNETAAVELLNDTATAVAQESKSNETKIGFFRSILLKIRSLGAKSIDSNVTANATESEAKANVTETENINETVEVEKTNETGTKESPQANETSSEESNSTEKEAVIVTNASEKDNATINLQDFVGAAEPAKNFNFQNYKYHIMAAIFTILIIAVLASGWLKKALDFFDED